MRKAGWLALILAFVAVSRGAATTTAMEAQIVVPPNLRVGDRALVHVDLSLPADAASPLLVTPSNEGEAVEVVRGRLLRSDARDPTANPLAFEVPIVARAPGTSILRIHALAYACKDTCKAIEVEARASVVVLAR